jgi:hypothetical protein
MGKELTPEYVLSYEELRTIAPKVDKMALQLAAEYDLRSHFSLKGHHVSPFSLHNDRIIEVNAANYNGKGSSKRFSYLLDISPEKMDGFPEVQACQGIKLRSHVFLRVAVAREISGWKSSLSWCDFFRYSVPYGKIKDNLIEVLFEKSRKLLSKAYRHHLRVQ